jgi:signal transduction histidine kinase
MPTSRNSGRPRALLGLIVATTLVPLGTLLWLGWRLLEQDRLLEAQQAQQRVERVADLAVAALQRAIAESERRLASGAEAWPEGAVALTFGRDSVEAFPAGRLAFLPVVAQRAHLRPSVFGRADELEFRLRDHAAATTELRRLASSSDPSIRAAALFRLARNLQKLGRNRDALEVYARLTELKTALVEGLPAEVAGTYARCRLFDSQKQTPALRAEAEHLARALSSSGRVLTAGQYWLYAGDVARWLGGDDPGPTEEEAFALTAAMLWDRSKTIAWATRGSATRELVRAEGYSLVVLWHSSNDTVRGLLATPRFVEREWLAAARPVLEEHRSSLALTGFDGKSLLSDTSAPERSGTPAPTAVRSAAQAELPWGLVVSGADPQNGAREFATRRRLLVTGCVVLVSMVLAASFFMARSVNRELAVAQLQSDFVAAVSHEFRTPLTSLRQFTDILRDARSLDEGKRSVCYEAQSRATDRLTRLVESLLDFGRMEAGAHPYRFERCDCGGLVEAVVDDFRRHVEPAGYDVTMTTNGSMQIEADGEALSRALWNLLDNAVKYSPDHHTVAVTLHGGDDSVRIAVQDRGIGIPTHEQDGIFRRFQRGEEARRRGLKGTGIGLSMVDHIVRAHHGRVQLESEPGKGSTFTIILPATRTPS